MDGLLSALFVITFGFVAICVLLVSKWIILYLAMVATNLIKWIFRR